MHICMQLCNLYLHSNFAPRELEKLNKSAVNNIMEKIGVSTLKDPPNIIVSFLLFIKCN